MKKLLLATTALAMSAGYAAADVTLSGDARMGITHDSALTSNKTAFTSRARVTFTLSGETDSGLAFGGSFRADNAGAAAAGTDGSVFISGEFGRLTMGNASGGAQFINGHVAGVGLTGLGDKNEMTYLGNPGAKRPTARFDYSIDGFSVAASHTDPGKDDTTASIGAGYSFEGFTVGVGYERENNKAAANITHIVASASFSMDAISVKATAGRLETAAFGGAAKVTQNQYALSATGSFDAISVTAFGKRDFNKDQHIGLGASYSLGGGASFVGGVTSTNFNAAGAKSRTHADLGLSFSF